MLDELKDAITKANYLASQGEPPDSHPLAFLALHGPDLIAAVEKAQRCKCQGWSVQKGWTSGDNFRTDEEKLDAS